MPSAPPEAAVVSPSLTPPPTTSAASGSASADLGTLRAAPARASAAAASAAGAAPLRDAPPGQDSPAAASGRTPERGVAADSAAAAGPTASPATAGPTFGATLAASLSASASASVSDSAAPVQAAPAQGAVRAPARGGRAKSADAQAPDTPGAASGSLAVAPLIAGNLPAQAPSAPATDANPGSTAVNGSDPGLAPAAAADGSPAHAGAAAAVTAALAAAREAPAAPGAMAPAARDDRPHADVAPGIDATPAAPISAPAHAALASALVAATRIEGGSPPGTTSDAGAPSGTANFAGANAAWSAPPPAATPADSSVGPQPPASPALTLHTEVGSTGWANELGTRLHWMANAAVGSASLRLTPEQLGPVEVRISVHQNSASVWFAAAQPETRTALEQALPQLRELFSAQGLNLAQAGVSDQSARGTPRHGLPSGVGAAASAVRELNATQVTSAPRLRQGLIDTYA